MPDPSPILIPALTPSGVVWRPLPDGWAGVRVATQAEADERLVEMLKVPKETGRVVLLTPTEAIDLTSYLMDYICTKCFRGGSMPRPFAGGWQCERCPYMVHLLGSISWLIVSGGPSPLHPDWVRSLRDQATAAGVPFFFAGWGEWGNKCQAANVLPTCGWGLRPDWERAVAVSVVGDNWGTMDITGKFWPTTTSWNGRQGDPEDRHEITVHRVGSAASGRLLDGRTWDEFPAPATEGG